jgi:hypothetical protein
VLDRPPTSYSRSFFSDRAAATWLSTEIQEVAQIKGTIETWAAYAACAERRWLERMVSVMFATARQLVPATSHTAAVAVPIRSYLISEAILPGIRAAPTVRFTPAPQDVSNRERPTFGHRRHARPRQPVSFGGAAIVICI